MSTSEIVTVPLAMADAPIAANTTPAMGHFNQYDATAGVLVPVLAALSTLRMSARTIVQKSDASANTVTVTCADGDTVADDGGTTIVLRRQGDQRELQVVAIGDTKYWKIVGSDPALPAVVAAGTTQAAARAAIDAMSTADLADAVTATVTPAADAAVTANIAGRDLVQRSDPGIPHAAATESTAYQQVWLGPNGEFIMGTRLDGSVEIAIPDIAGGTTRSVQAEDLLWAAGVYGPDGQIPEACLDAQGRFPQWVANRLKARMGLGGFSSTTSWPMDIVVLAGQSNATQLSSLTATIEPAVQDVLVWNGATFDQASGVPWLGSGFARRYAELHGRPENRRVAVVKTALGSTGFSSLTPGTWDRTVTTGAAAYLYPAMIAAAQAALAAAPSGSRIIGVVWSQGEQDSGVGLATYQAKLDDLIAQARIDLGISDLPFIIGSMTPEIVATGGAGYGSINNILEDTPRRVVRTAFVPGPKNMADVVGAGIHWNPMGQRIRGKTMAESGYNTALLNMTTSVPLPPVNLRVSRAGDVALIEWDHPETRVTSYTIETSIDSGTTWVTETLTAATTHTLTINVAADTPLWVRGKATNEVGTSLTTMEVHA